jgi:ISXO2-like transposase domain/Transposase zinc-ribbon domain
MSKNQIQFQKGYSLPEFIKNYGTEEQCKSALFKWRWPEGFRCPVCGGGRYTLVNTRKLYQCGQCRHQTSLISGTIFEQTKLPLRVWFLAMYLISQAKTGLSALSLKRQVGVSYNTAWGMKQKIMQVMEERDDQKPLGGWVQLDDVYWGGERRGGKRGRGAENKTPFIAAVALNDQGHPLAMNLHVVEGFKLTEIARWAKQHLQLGSKVVSDGLACFSAVRKAGCHHDSIVTGGGPASVTREEFTWVNTMIGNVKRAINGTYHAISPKHLPRYLAEFCYRFNRRFQLEEMLPRLVYAAARTPPMPGCLLKLAEDYG